jgi:hypothetical protein
LRCQPPRRFRFAFALGSIQTGTEDLCQPSSPSFDPHKK